MCAPWDLDCHLQEFLNTEGIQQANAQMVEWLVRLPDWTVPSPDGKSKAVASMHDATEAVVQRQQDVTSIAIGLLGLVVVIAVVRYWAAGMMAGDAGAALTALGRSVAAGAALIAYPTIFTYGVGVTNALTAAISAGSGRSMTGLIKQALDPQGSAALAILCVAVGFYLLIFVKLIIAQVLAIVYVLTPLAIAVSPLKEGAPAFRACGNAFAAICASMVALAVSLSVVGLLAPAVSEDAATAKIPMVTGLTLCCGLIMMVKLVGLIFRQASLNSSGPHLGRSAMSVAKFGGEFALRSALGSRGAGAAAAQPPPPSRPTTPSVSVPRAQPSLGAAPTRAALEGRPTMQATAERVPRGAVTARTQPAALEAGRSALPGRARGSASAPPPSPSWRGHVYQGEPAASGGAIEAKPAAYALGAGPIGKHGGGALVSMTRHPSGAASRIFEATPAARALGISSVGANYPPGSDVPSGIWHMHEDGRKVKATPVAPVPTPSTTRDLPSPPEAPTQPSPFSRPPPEKG